MSDDVMAIMGLSGFGKPQKKRQLDAGRFDKTKRAEQVPIPGPSKPSPPPKVATPVSEPVYDPSAPELNAAQPAVAKQSMEDHDEGDEPQYDDSDDLPLFPTTHELLLKDHTKVVSALTLDPSGARVLSGAHDYDCKLWDFGGMTANPKPFKTWEPAGSYYVHDLKYSNAGDKFLCITGTSQPRIYDRDADEESMVEFIKGDPYIRDMKNTSGHVADLSACCWHPKEAQIFITSSADSTIRIWDVENKRKQKTVIVVKSKERGTRTKVTACTYSGDGKIIAAACLDGTLHLWNTSSNFVRPNSTVEGAHTKNTETGSVIFSLDGRTLLSRGGDDTVKLWDIRAFKKPVTAHAGLTTLYPQTNAIFSPDEKYVLTGASASAKGQRGRLVFLKRDTFEVAQEMEMASSVVKVAWHSKINQILTGLANGQISVLYSPLTSTNGAKLLASKGPPRKRDIEDMSDSLIAPPILTPHALPMYRDGDAASGISGTKRKREKDRADPRKSRRPELPVSGPGRGGRVGASATQHVVRNLVRDTTRDEDPREALLKYAQVAEEDPQWTAAWQANQPKPVFQEIKDEGEEREEE